MRENVSLFSLAAVGFTAFALVATVFMSSGEVLAASASPGAAAGPSSPPSCACPGSSNGRQKPKFAELHGPMGSSLDTADEVAVLSSVHQALTATADGATYIWHRANGRISGLVQPTSSFKNVDGQVCRHLVIMLTTGNKTRKTEGIACRAGNGIWSLEG